MKTGFLKVVGLAAGLLVGVTATVRAQFDYAIHDGTVTITKYTGAGGDVVIPDTIAGRLVTSFGYWAFRNCTVPTSITIPDGVTSIRKAP